MGWWLRRHLRTGLSLSSVFRADPDGWADVMSSYRHSTARLGWLREGFPGFSGFVEPDGDEDVSGREVRSPRVALRPSRHREVTTAIAPESIRDDPRNAVGVATMAREPVSRRRWLTAEGFIALPGQPPASVTTPPHDSSAHSSHRARLLLLRSTSYNDGFPVLHVAIARLRVAGARG